MCNGVKFSKSGGLFGIIISMFKGYILGPSSKKIIYISENGTL